MNVIWATRGKTWGFRFLLSGRQTHALALYEEAFAGVDSSPEVFQRRAGVLAVRFADPEGRKDRSGRLIPHEFVVLPPESQAMENFRDAQIALWKHVGARYAEVWDLPSGPSRSDVDR
jgi:hypothetical protein